MKNHHIPTLALLLACSVSWLTACGATEQPAAALQEAGDTIGTRMEEASKEIKHELENENISLSSDDKKAPDAELTPDGRLLIDGKEVALDAQQRALMLDYRKRIAEVAMAGADIGMEAAGMAGDVLGNVAKGLLNGNMDEMEARIEEEAAGIAASAKMLCERLPALLAAQQAAAAAVPEFAPYASMTQSDVDDCHVEMN